MHLFDVGLFQTHCRQVWGIDASTLGSDMTMSSTAKAIQRPSDSELDKWYEIIRTTRDTEHLQEQLNGNDCTRDVLWHICSDHDLHRAGAKKQLARNIADWVSVLMPLNQQIEEFNLDTVFDSPTQQNLAGCTFLQCQENAKRP